MRRSKKLIMQGTGNGCGSTECVIIQGTGNGCGGTECDRQNKIKTLARENNLFSACIFGHPLSVRPAYKFQKRAGKEKRTGDRRSLQKEMK